MQDMEIMDIFNKMGAYQQGHFRLSSGLHSGGYLQCARVLQDPIVAARLCGALAEKFRADRPDIVLVVGDVNSTIGCGLVAVKLGVRLVHVEAGLRSGDRSMPEEINRVLTDSISDMLFCTEQSGVDNLIREGIGRDKIHLVGHVMIDTLLKNLEKARKSQIVGRLQEQGCLNGDQYAMLTLDES